MLNSRFVRVYLIPGAVFQSVVVGGGYGTGREIVEYFTQYGMAGGLLAMGITVVCWAVVLGVTYELARLFQVYDYRRFFKVLLGPAWVAFEVLYLLMLVLVLAVVASAAGEILLETFGLPYAVGLVVMLALISVLAFFGREVVARVLTVWSGVLYLVFILYFILVFSQFSEVILTAFADGEAGAGWSVSGFKYAMYNLAIAPAILFAVRDIETRREAFLSGLISALICAFPAMLFHISFIAGYPDILEAEVPVYRMVDELGMPVLVGGFVLVLFGTFIETGVGFVQGVNERIDAYLLEKHGTTLSKRTHALIAVVGMLASAGLATIGIVTLIADGYGLISWGFFAVYVVPVVTVGVYRIVKRTGLELPS